MSNETRANPFAIKRDRLLDTHDATEPKDQKFGFWVLPLGIIVLAIAVVASMAR